MKISSLILKISTTIKAHKIKIMINTQVRMCTCYEAIIRMMAKMNILSHIRKLVEVCLMINKYLDAMGKMKMSKNQNMTNRSGIKNSRGSRRHR